MKRGDFGLHLELAGRRALMRRLNRSAVAALVMAVVGWFVPDLHVLMHLLLVVGFAGVVGLLPVSGGEAWAFRYIRESSGLAYETAIGLEGQPRDDFGLRSAIRSRARTRIAGLERPRYPEWWLAGFVIALAIVLLPALGISPPGTQVTPPESQPPAAAAPAPDEDESTEDQTAEPELLPEDEAILAAPQPPQDAGAPAAEAGTAGEGQGEGQVLDRFLDNLRARPEPEGGDSTLFAEPREAEGEDEADEPGGSEPGDAPEEPGDEQSDGSPGDGEADEDGEGQDGSGGESGEDGAPQDEDGAGAQDGDLPEPAGADDASMEQSDSGAGDATLDGGADGADGEDGMGSGPGASVVQVEQGLEAGGEEEFLQGILEGDEFNLGGDVRLPGFSDVELPPGSSPASLGEAVERSVTEGSVPLEYQEVIRNYFR